MFGLTKLGYLSDASLLFFKIYFAVYFIFFAIMGINKFGKKIQHLTKIALVWYIIAGLLYLPIAFSTYNTYSWQILLSGYCIYFFVIGMSVFISLLYSAAYDRTKKSFLFSFAYLIPGIISLLCLSYLPYKSLANLVVEPFLSGVATSIIYLLDCRFSFSIRHRTIIILISLLVTCLIGIFIPSLPE